LGIQKFPTDADFCLEKIKAFGLIDLIKPPTKSDSSSLGLGDDERVAKRSDLIAVTGEIGSASYNLNNKNSSEVSALHTPESQLTISQEIRKFAHVCIDITNGLITDLEHMCLQSKLAAKISFEQIPVNPQVKGSTPDWSKYVLSGGNDCQLYFTFAPENLDKLPNNCTVIGQMGCGTDVKVYVNNQELKLGHKGFIHFS